MNRKFVFLEEIDGGYSSDKKGLKGHIQIEQKKEILKIDFFIENLKNGGYGIDMIMDNHTIKKISIQDIIDNKLKIHIKCKEKLTSIKVIIIYPLNDNYKVVLAGWINTKENIDLREFRYIENKINTNNIQNNNIIDKEIKINNENIKKIEKESNNNNEKEKIDKTINISANKDNEEQNIKKESKDVNKKNVSNNSENKNNFGDNFANNKTQMYYLWENLSALDDILNKYEPFIQKIPNHEWWKIEGHNMRLQSFYILYNGYLMPMIYPFMNYKNIGKTYMDDYNHWIFGTVLENINNQKKLKYFVYGIPGKFYIQEQPFKGSTGYFYWQSTNTDNNDKIGYWLLYVDVQTGKIVIPRRPAKPPLNRNIMHKE